MPTTSMPQSRTMTALSEPFLNTKWRLHTSARILTEPGFASLKHQRGLHVVGVAGFARPWSRLSRGGAHLVQVVSDARATICHVLADRQRRHGRRLVMASGATKQGVLQLAYEVCAFLSIAAMGIAPDQALAHCKLGWIAYRQADRAARAHFTDSLARASRAQYAEGIADALAGLGALALENRQWQRAARLLGASDGLRAAVGDVLHTTDDLADDGWLVSLRRQLGRPAFEAEWRAGQSAPVEQILSEALS